MAAIEGNLVTLDLAAPEIRQHRLVRRPQCPACVEPARGVATGPVMLTSRPKSFTADGGYRVRSPQQTLDRFGHQVSPLTGVVRELRRFPTDTDLITVYAGMSPGSATPTSLAALRRDHSAGSAGKGRSDAQARASALCEAIERLSGSYTGEEPRVRGTWAELRDQAVYPADLVQVSDAQYAAREAWNREHSVFAWVPERFDESRAIGWTPAWSLTEDRAVYLPSAFCWYDYPTEHGHRFCVGDSNGNASGNNPEEAIVQGFMELVERDSVAIWWYNRLRRPAVDLDSFDDPYLRALLAEYARRGREVWALDLTTDLGVPVYAAVSRALHGPERIVQGYGAHCDPRIALSRALTELNLMYALVTGGPLDFDHDPDNEHWYQAATVANQPYLRPDPALPATTLSAAGGWHSADLRDDVRHCAELVRRHGMRMLVLDQTRPDLELSVVKVVVPGLRHFWARFAPGRLYDVPVAMGWLAQPTLETELNPLPVSS
jgi:ribosomal protein S12 methylthiotransferase accessory factor